MKARIRRISASVDTAFSPTSSSDQCINAGGGSGGCCHDHSLTNMNTGSSQDTLGGTGHHHHHAYNNPSSKSLDICVPESRIERMRKLLSSPLLKRRSQHQQNQQQQQQQLCHHQQQQSHPQSSSSSSSLLSHHGHHHHHHHHYNRQLPQPSSSSSSPSSSPALGGGVGCSSMKTFGVSLESLAHHQHPHHQLQHPYPHLQHRCPEEYYVRDPEQIVVPHQKAAHILGQACPGCLTSAPSNSSSTGSINDTSSGHFSPHGNPANLDDLHSSLSSIAGASPSSGNSSSSTTSSTASSTGGGTSSGNIPCLIPYIVTRLCTYIENSGGMVQEGLFRISGNAKLVDKLKQSFDNLGDAPLESDGDLAAAAALLKQFLRELPQPLIPNGSQFLDVIRSLKNDRETCVLSLKALVSQLPDENYYTLRYLIRFLYRIAQRNEENRMTSTNLGIVFAPNIFRVCVDTYQGLKDQSSANEVVNLLISDFTEIFNESGDPMMMSSGGGGSTDVPECQDGSVEGTGSSGDISYDSESHCPFTYSIGVEQQQKSSNNDQIGCQLDNQQLQQQQQEFELSSPSSKPSTSSLDNVSQIPDTSSNNSTTSSSTMTMLSTSCSNQEIRLKLDRKRKSYQNKNHRTIDEFNEEDRCQSFDSSQQNDNVSQQNSTNRSEFSTNHHHHRHHHHHQPQRCNSEEMKYSKSDVGVSISACPNNSTVGTRIFGLKKDDPYRKNSHSHEIIITNSSDSVSTDDNTTTATSTGPTVCSVIIGVEQLDVCKNNSANNQSGGDMTDISEDNFAQPIPDYSKLLTCDMSSEMKTGTRSSSCGSDCTENINVPTSLLFESEDDDDDGDGDDNVEGEDSLLKSIASECTSGDNDNGNGSSTGDDVSGSNGDQPPEQSNTANQGNSQMGSSTKISSSNQSTSKNHLIETKPWCTSDTELAVDAHHNEPSLLLSKHHHNVRQQECLETEPEAQQSTTACQYLTSNQPMAEPNGGTTTNTAPSPNRHRENNSQLDPEKLTKSRNFRRLQSIRRKLKQFEVDFEQENGFPATFENKMVSSFARPLMLELSTLLNVDAKHLKHFDSNIIVLNEQKTLKCNREISSANFPEESEAKSTTTWKYNVNIQQQSQQHPFSTEDIFNTIFGNRKEKSLARIGEMMSDIQRTLDEKRTIAQRPESLDEMTPEQIFDEKLALQKALLRFEALCGRPNSKAERDIVRPVYDRYRLVKRYASKFNHLKSGQKCSSASISTSSDAATVAALNELQPILENVQMNFTSPTHHSTNKLSSLILDQMDQIKSTKPTDLSTDSSSYQRACDTFSSTISSSTMNKDKNYHIMSRAELLAHLQEYRQQKRNLRSVLRTFENDFYKKTGRRVEKEDRSNMSSVYTCYKNIKGKIKLIEALISKKIPKE